jgi:hypothetical protein
MGEGIVNFAPYRLSGPSAQPGHAPQRDGPFSGLLELTRAFNLVNFQQRSQTDTSNIPISTRRLPSRPARTSSVRSHDL